MTNKDNMDRDLKEGIYVQIPVTLYPANGTKATIMLRCIRSRMHWITMANMYSNIGEFNEANECLKKAVKEGET